MPTILQLWAWNRCLQRPFWLLTFSISIGVVPDPPTQCYGFLALVVSVPVNVEHESLTTTSISCVGPTKPVHNNFLIPRGWHPQPSITCNSRSTPLREYRPPQDALVINNGQDPYVICSLPPNGHLTCTSCPCLGLYPNDHTTSRSISSMPCMGHPTATSINLHTLGDVANEPYRTCNKLTPCVNAKSFYQPWLQILIASKWVPIFFDTQCWWMSIYCLNTRPWVTNRWS